MSFVNGDGPPPGDGADRHPVEVSVIVVTFDSAAVLPGFLTSLPAGLEGVEAYELIVVDNASQDGTVALARTMAPLATVVELPHNEGYSAGFNAGVAVARRFNAVLLVNPDVRFRSGAVRPLLAALAYPGTGITVPRLLSDSGELELSLRREPTVRRALGEAVLGGRRAGHFGEVGEVVVNPVAYRHGRAVDWASGAVMAMSRQCLEASGAPGPGGRGRPWDESFFLYSEETEFALRARDAGFSLRYVPEAEAVHIGGQSGTSPQLWSLLTRNRVRLYRRRHGPLRGAAFWLAVVLNESLRVGRGPVHRAALRSLLGLGGRRDGRPRRGSAPGYICFSAQDWWYHNQAHSDFQLMRGVAATRTVLLINSIAMRMPLPGRSPQFLRRIARKAASMAKLLRQPLPDLPGYWVLTPFIVPLYGFGWARAANARLVRLQVALAARRLGIGEAVCIVTVPTAWEVARSMANRGLVYNRSDKHSAFEEVNQEYIRSLEDQLLRSADRVLYVSRTLMATEASLTGNRSVFLDHGVDLVHFTGDADVVEPADLAAIPRPRIGFFGGLDDYTVDFDLLERLAREIPEAHLVLVGDATCSMARFDRMHNVHALGFRAYADIPAYGSGFDVAIMPWLSNDWIRHSNPIKLKEYLALGLAVVSTDFPEVRPYDHLVRVAENPDDFMALVRETLDDGGLGSPAERRAAVAGASWARRAEQLIGLCENAEPHG
ncbi:MAG: glycosyltransferase [Acidimicrobiales bacterium]